MENSIKIIPLTPFQKKLYRTFVETHQNLISNVKGVSVIRLVQNHIKNHNDNHPIINNFQLNSIPDIINGIFLDYSDKENILLGEIEKVKSYTKTFETFSIDTNNNLQYHNLKQLPTVIRKITSQDELTFERHTTPKVYSIAERHLTVNVIPPTEDQKKQYIEHFETLMYKDRFHFEPILYPVLSQDQLNSVPDFIDGEELNEKNKTHLLFNQFVPFSNNNSYTISNSGELVKTFEKLDKNIRFGNPYKKDISFVKKENCIYINEVLYLDNSTPNLINEPQVNYENLTENNMEKLNQFLIANNELFEISSIRGDGKIYFEDINNQDKAYTTNPEQIKEEKWTHLTDVTLDQAKEYLQQANGITKEMLDAAKVMISIDMLNASDLEKEAYWKANGKIQGYNVHKDGSLTVRSKAINSDFYLTYPEKPLGNTDIITKKDVYFKPQHVKEITKENLTFNTFTVIEDLKITVDQRKNFDLTKEQLKKIPDILDGNKLSDYQKKSFAVGNRIDFLNPEADDELKARFILEKDGKILAFYPCGEECFLKTKDVSFNENLTFNTINNMSANADLEKAKDLNVIGFERPLKENDRIAIVQDGKRLQGTIVAFQENGKVDLMIKNSPTIKELTVDKDAKLEPMFKINKDGKEDWLMYNYDETLAALKNKSDIDLKYNSELTSPIATLMYGNKTDVIAFDKMIDNKMASVEGRLELRRNKDGEAYVHGDVKYKELNLDRPVYGLQLDEQQKEDLTNKKDIGLIQGFKSKDGNEYSLWVSLDDQLNKVVTKPERAININMIFGVKTTEEQREQLKSGQGAVIINKKGDEQLFKASAATKRADGLNSTKIEKKVDEKQSQSKEVDKEEKKSKSKGVKM